MDYILNFDLQEQIDSIDFYIEIGYSYEDAYLMWQDDYNRGQLPSQVQFAEELEQEELRLAAEADEEETSRVFKQAIIKLAVSRGYVKTEAQTMANKVVEMKRNGQYDRAYKLFLARLFA